MVGAVKVAVVAEGVAGVTIGAEKTFSRERAVGETPADEKVGVYVG